MTTVRSFLVALAGLVLVQAAWVLVVPPFRGLDEHEHALRADSVAAGHLGPMTIAGMGDAVLADADLVAASTPVCEWFPTGIAVNCDPLGPEVDGRVPMRSSAAAYHPTFYLLVGWAAQPFGGYAELYAMRIAASLLCALLVAGALAAAHRGSGSWTAWGLLVALTPTMTYSLVVASPNGVELAAAALLWCSLLALGRAGSVRTERTLLATAGLASVVMCTVRSLGPGWVLLTVGTAVALLGLQRASSVLRAHPVTATAVTLAVGAAAAWSAWWTLSTGTNDPTGLRADNDPPGVLLTLAQPILWVAQAMGAFPARDELAPLGVLALLVGLYWVFLSIVFRIGDRRGRRVLLLTVFVSVAVPMAISIATHPTLGFSWQGRYGWPYTMGLALVGGYLLDRAADGAAAAPTRGMARLVIVTVMGVATAWAQLDVLADQVRTSPLTDTDHWVRAPAPAVALLTACGFALLAVAASSGRRPTIQEPEALADNLVR